MKRIIIIASLLALAAPAHAGQRLRDCRAKVETLTAIILADVDECLPSETSYWLALCPQDCWSIANPETGSQVCCNPYGSDDGIEDGSCVTRSSRNN